MSDDQGPFTLNATSTKSGKGSTRLSSPLKCDSGERTPLTIDVSTGVASGPKAENFISYLGVMACEKIYSLGPSWIMWLRLVET